MALVPEDEFKTLQDAIAAETATLVGGTEPCRETKWTYWRVYEWKDGLYAVVCAYDGYMTCAEKIKREDLSQYTE